MLQRVQHQGVVFYRSELLHSAGVPHGFSTRIGGVSPPPFASLNLGNPQGCSQPDAPAAIAENFCRFQAAVAADGRLHAFAQQVHGAGVLRVAAEGETEYAETLSAEVTDRWQGQQQADALWTTEPRVAVSVRVADCVPVLLCSPDGRAVAAIHAGWRGVAANVVANAVAAMAGGAGVRPAQMLAAVGPAISAAHFAIGPEVAAALRDAGVGPMVQEHGTQWYGDLPGAVALQLQEAGIQQIDQTDRCTYTHETEFFSHRRDHGLTGRHAALIAPRWA